MPLQVEADRNARHIDGRGVLARGRDQVGGDIRPLGHPPDQAGNLVLLPPDPRLVVPLPCRVEAAGGDGSNRSAVEFSRCDPLGDALEGGVGGLDHLWRALRVAEPVHHLRPTPASGQRAQDRADIGDGRDPHAAPAERLVDAQGLGAGPAVQRRSFRQHLLDGATQRVPDLGRGRIEFVQDRSKVKLRLGHASSGHGAEQQR
jgi:hypothetical protein